MVRLRGTSRKDCKRWNCPYDSVEAYLTAPHKLRHDAEQLRYIASKSCAVEVATAYVLSLLCVYDLILLCYVSLTYAICRGIGVIANRFNKEAAKIENLLATEEPAQRGDRGGVTVVDTYLAGLRIGLAPTLWGYPVSG